MRKEMNTYYTLVYWEGVGLFISVDKFCWSKITIKVVQINICDLYLQHAKINLGPLPK